MILATSQICLLQARSYFLLTSTKSKNMMSRFCLILKRNILRVLSFLHCKKQTKRSHFFPTNFHSTPILCFVFFSILHLRKEVKKNSRFMNKNNNNYNNLYNYGDRKTSKITKTLLLYH